MKVEEFLSMIHKHCLLAKCKIRKTELNLTTMIIGICKFNLKPFGDEAHHFQSSAEEVKNKLMRIRTCCELGDVVWIIHIYMHKRTSHVQIISE